MYGNPSWSNLVQILLIWYHIIIITFWAFIFWAEVSNLLLYSKSKKWLLPLTSTTYVRSGAHRDFSQVIGSFAMMRFVFLSGDCSSEHRLCTTCVCCFLAFTYYYIQVYITTVVYDPKWACNMELVKVGTGTTRISGCWVYPNIELPIMGWKTHFSLLSYLMTF